MSTFYEFVVETLEFYTGCGDDPDIIDTSAFETLSEAEKFTKGIEEPWRIALRRDTGDEDEGLTDRWYAYPNENGVLPEFFSDAASEGPKIPVRFKSVVFPVDRRDNRHSE